MTSSSREKRSLSDRAWRQHLVAALVLAVVIALVEAPLALQGRVLASYDAEVYFYPHAAYLAARLSAGQIPLWDPYLFAGVPFLANSQVGALYPPNWAYLLGPVSRVYAGLVVFHTWWLGLGVYILARRSTRLGWSGALVAALCVSAGGYAGGMVGHLNQLEALSWAPYAILAVERAAARQSWRWAFAASVAFTLMILAGHTQVVYIAGLAAALAGIGRVIQFSRGAPRSSLPAQLTRVAVGPVLAVFLAMPQLLPMLELTRLGIRSGGLDFADGAAFSFPPPYALVGLLPTVGQLPPSSEWLGYVGLSALLLAGFALWRRPNAQALSIAGFAAAGLVLALGQYTPAYGVAFAAVPGFDLFRVPARWLFWWTLGIGLLAGHGMDLLTVGKTGAPSSGQVARGDDLRNQERRPWFRDSRRQVALPLALGAAIVVAAEAYHQRRLIAWPGEATLLLWSATLIAFVGLVLLARRWRATAAGILVLLVAELVFAAGYLPSRDAVWPSVVELPGAEVAHLLARHSGDRVLALGDNSFDPGDIQDLRAMLSPTLPSGAVVASITAIKYIKDLAPNVPLTFGIRTLDGYDGGVLPLARFNALKQIFPLQGKDIPDGRLRLRLVSAPDPRLLGWLNVRYLVMDRLRDRWVGGVYYDLGVSLPLQPGQSIVLPVDPAFPSTAIGVALSGPGAAAPNGNLAIEANGLPLGASATANPSAGARLAGTASGDAWLTRAPLDRPSVVHSLRLTWNGTHPTVLRSASLIDTRTGRSAPVVVDPRYRLDYLGDLKIYRDEAALPRAFLSRGMTVVPNQEAAIARLRQPNRDAQSSAVAVSGDVNPNLAFQTDGDPGTARIQVDEPERVVVQTSASGPRALVLTDSYYPGWSVTVDGRDARILPVDLLFRGVILAPGEHQVIFSYRPMTWRLGLIVGAGAAVVLVLGLWRTGR